MTEHDSPDPAAADAPTPDAAPSDETMETPATAPADEATATEPAPAPEPGPRPMPAGRSWWMGTGRRKSSVARVRLRPGSGQFLVNKRPVEEYFTGERNRKDINTVLERTRTTSTLDVHVSVNGGGITGQTGAIVLGLARALRQYDGSLEPILRDSHFLTRDPREVERKKYGQPGARARFQFSKR
jgi:small subunit ribosomal protein S9